MRGICFLCDSSQCRCISKPYALILPKPYALILPKPLLNPLTLKEGDAHAAEPLKPTGHRLILPVF